ncbi:MAG: dihydropteroate synthase [Clostridia bacterium]|nr:dihydropteroate synthase [Clostridia bacterium]
MPQNVFRCRDTAFPLGCRTYIMGILNLTPDSFSDGGLYVSREAALVRALEMQTEGADLIDVGAVSTRPGSVPADEAEELRRLSFLGEICGALSVPVSVDTYRPRIVEYALSCGAKIINDVSGEFNPDMASLVRESGCGYIVMHSPTRNAGDAFAYPEGVVRHVQCFFDEIMARLSDAGVLPQNICLDPGFGFGKNTQENLLLLQGLDALDTGGVCLLSALSRKRFVRVLTDAPAEDCDAATAAGCVISVQKGADMVRVHNVRDCARAVRLADLVYRT